MLPETATLEAVIIIPSSESWKGCSKFLLPTCLYGLEGTQTLHETLGIITCPRVLQNYILLLHTFQSGCCGKCDFSMKVHR